MKKIGYILIVNSLVFMALIGVIEGVSRIIFPENEMAPIFNDRGLRTRERPFVELHKDRGFALKPGFSNGVYRVNANGFRGGDLPDDLNDKTVILTLGESTTFGWGVKDNETYPYYLMSAFPDDQDVHVINGGVPSYTSSQVLMTLKELLYQKNFKPDLILICIVWNDIWYSTIRNWHPDILVYQKPPEWVRLLTQYSRFGHGLVMGFSRPQKQVDIFNGKALDHYGKNIEEMIQICLEEKIPLAFVDPPFDADHMPDTGLNEFHVRYSKSFFIQTARAYIAKLNIVAEKYGIPVIRHTLGMANLHQRSLFLDPLHPTAEGNSILAGGVYTALFPLLKK